MTAADLELCEGPVSGLRLQEPTTDNWPPCMAWWSWDFLIRRRTKKRKPQAYLRLDTAQISSAPPFILNSQADNRNRRRMMPEITTNGFTFRW